MKTFIWNRQYEVLVVNANSIEEARKLLKPILKKFLDVDIKSTIERAKAFKKNYPDQSYCDPGYYKDDSWWNREIEYVRKQTRREKRILLRKPNHIIDEGEALIFNHSNP